MIPTVRALIASIFLTLVPPAWAEPRSFTIDEDHLSIVFLVDHIGYARQFGQFLDAGGAFVYDPEANRLDSGEVTISADSVFTNHGRRDRHLRNEDFLDAGAYPDIRFVVTGHRLVEGDRHQVDGDLTLLGQTRPVTLDVTLNKAADYPFGHGGFTLGLSASTTIRRSDWGMDYGISGGLVGDEVELMFEFEAIAD
jgi:polyisoprenoid-binding protein YceI